MSDYYEGVDVMLATDTMLVILVCLVSVWYFSTWVYRISWNVGGVLKDSHSFLTSHYSRISSDCLLISALFHCRYPIAPWSNHDSFYPIIQFTLCFSLSSNFWCSWLDGDADWYSSLWTDKAVLFNEFLSSETASLKPSSNAAFPDPVPSSVHELSKIFISEYLSGWSCKTNPPNVLPPIWNPERPPHPHTTSKSQNVPNYHFHLGLLSTNYPPAPQYENPPQLFQ